MSNTLRVRLSVAVGLLIPTISSAQCDFRPTAREVVLDTNFTQVVTANCAPYNVAGGVFVFRNVHIPAGVTVRGVGSNPLVILATGTFRVDGTLTVRGGDGARVDTLNSANFPTAGGVGACGGGNGGLGSPNSTGRSPTGEAGYGPFQVPGGGGLPGSLALYGGCLSRGSGGGGGAFGTRGDPGYRTLSNGTSAVQQLGIGGFGGASSCPGRLPAGGIPGLRAFLDGVPDNDFWGLSVDLFGGRLVSGELRGPRGGAGGGGGGDRPADASGLNWIADAKGGGGGGGGGALVVVSLGVVTVGPTGRIDADGGHGGGGEQAGSNNQGGGGAGGSGGMVVIYSDTGIELHAHGETYANGDHSFAVSADGGAGLKGRFGGTPIDGKYPPISAAVWDALPSGGLGGMGVVQLIVPFGNNADGTNTILDDNVHIVRNGVRVFGAEKQRFLGWRGWFDPNGSRWVGEFGLPTGIDPSTEGDIRPSPVLLPILR